MKLVLILLVGVLMSGCSTLSKAKVSKEGKAKLAKKEEVSPLLTKPKVRKVWVKDKVIGNRYIKGHWEYIIKENSQWSR